MPRDIANWLDGVPTSTLPLPDRGLEFGDGLFETLLVHNNRPLYQELHLARLHRGAQVLGFPDCDEVVRDQLQMAVAAASSWPWSAVRITLTRGAGPRGYAPPENATPRVLITVTRLDHNPMTMQAPAVLGLASVGWPQQPLLAGLKHLNRLEQVLAAQQYRKAGFDEAVMLDQQGRVISVVAGNLFVVSAGEILTAPLDSCGIAGTRRQLIMHSWAPRLGLTACEKILSVEQLENAEEVFYSNSLLGLRPAARFGGRSWSTHATCAALHRLYQDELV